MGVIAPAHKDVVKMMLNNGKAVLCEKPLGLNLNEVFQSKPILELAGNLFHFSGERDDRAGKTKESFLRGGCLESHVPNLCSSD